VPECRSNESSELLHHHEGKFALAIGDELVGVFDRQEDADRAGIEKGGNVPMLIRRIVREEPVPAVVRPYGTGVLPCCRVDLPLLLHI
jgi:class 3 adenylate cyclase